MLGSWPVGGAEGSQHLHNLIQGLAKARALHEARTTGVPTTAGNLANITGRYRRILSCAFVRATESCLLARLGHLDAGAREAAQRRQVTVREEEKDRREEAAHFQAYVRGRGGARRGRLPGSPGQRRGPGGFQIRLNCIFKYLFMNVYNKIHFPI